jgi:hypothetical protein
VKIVRLLDGLTPTALSEIRKKAVLMLLHQHPTEGSARRKLLIRLMLSTPSNQPLPPRHVTGSCEKFPREAETRVLLVMFRHCDQGQPFPQMDTLSKIVHTLQGLPIISPTFSVVTPRHPSLFSRLPNGWRVHLACPSAPACLLAVQLPTRA